MIDRFHRVPLLLLVITAAALAIGFYALGAGFLTAPIKMGDTIIAKSVADLSKDALFVPLKPLMYALIVMTIGSSLAISKGGIGAKFIRVISYFLFFSTIGAVVAISCYSFFADLRILPDPTLAVGDLSKIKTLSSAEKAYGVLTSPLMISIYGGIIFGQALKRTGLGLQADAVSDLFLIGFRKFLQFTIPLAVFGSITLALNKEGGVETLTSLSKLLIPYSLTFGFVWVVMIFVTSLVLGRSVGFVLRGIFPQAVVALSTSSSVATLPATKVACADLGANGDECTPFFTIGATINMTGTVMGLTILSLYAMGAYGLDISFADKCVVALQSLVYSVSAAGVPSASVVLLQDILTSQGVSAEYATFVTGLIITIDTLFLDRMRTVLNTQSDSMSTVNALHGYYKKPRVLEG